MENVLSLLSGAALIGATGYTLGVLQQLRQQYRADAVLAAKRLEILDLRAALLQCVASLEQADCREGYCCCGDLESNHSMGTGHAFTDEGTYRQSVAIRTAHDVLTRCASVSTGVTK